MIKQRATNSRTLQRLAIGLTLAATLVHGHGAAGGNDPHYDYVLYCAGCHLETGGGKPPEVPDLRRDLNVLVHLVDGRGYLARVPGVAHTPMDDRQVAELLNWMLARFYPDLVFEPYTAREVGGFRQQPLLDPLRVRAELMQRGQSTAARD